MDQEIRVIKKYPNRRLYDTETSAYITVEDVKQLVLDGADIQVVDAKTKEDITRSILLQIVLEEEANGTPMFSSEVLTQFIRFYGQAMQGMMGPFLEKNLHLFLQLQQQMREQTHSLYGDNAMLNNKMWNDFLGLQGPAMQNMMTGYLNQSAQLYLDMQQRMQEQAKQMFSSFPFGAQPPEDDNKQS